MIRLASVLLLAFSIGPVQAKTIYECDLPEQEINRGWLPTKVIVAYDSGDAEAVVNDPMIQYVHGKPINVKPHTDNAKRLRLQWTLVLPSTQQNEFTLNFDFTIFKADLTAKVSGFPRGYSQTMNATGKCKKLKQ